MGVTTPICCATVAFVYFDFIADDHDHTGAGDMLLPGSVLVIAFLMSRAFAAIWEQVIQSLTVCVLHDVDTFGGRFLRDDMRTAFGDPEKAKDEATSS